MAEAMVGRSGARRLVGAMMEVGGRSIVEVVVRSTVRSVVEVRQVED